MHVQINALTAAELGYAVVSVILGVVNIFYVANQAGLFLMTPHLALFRDLLSLISYSPWYLSLT